MSSFTLYRLSAQYAGQRVAAMAKRLRVNESGQDIVEYAGMLAIIALVVVAIMALGLPGIISGALKGAVNSITSPSSSGAAAKP